MLNHSVYVLLIEDQYGIMQQDVSKILEVIPWGGGQVACRDISSFVIDCYHH